MLWPDASLSSHHSFQELFVLKFSPDLQRNLLLHLHMTANRRELNHILCINFFFARVISLEKTQSAVKYAGSIQEKRLRRRRKKKQGNH